LNTRAKQIGAVLAAVTAVLGAGTALTGLSKWPLWVALVVVPLGSAALTWIWTGSPRRTALAGVAGIGIAVAAGTLVTRNGDGEDRADVLSPGGPVERKKFDPWYLPLGGTPWRTVIYGDTVWTLTNGGLLARGDAAGRSPLPTIQVPTSAEDMLLCGSFLVILTDAGVATLRRARDGVEVRDYPFAKSGPADAATCSASYLWILRGRVLARVPIPEMGKADVETKELEPHVDAIFYWRDRVWTQDAQSGDLIGYDETDINARSTAQLSGDADLLGLRRSLVASHQGTSCLRTIDFAEEAESRAGTPLTPNPIATGSDGNVGVIADRSLKSFTVVRDGVLDAVRTYELPMKDLRVTGAAINDKWIALGDASEPRAVVFRRSQLGLLKRKSNKRLNACP
jgi:hypothetical protein